MTMRRLVVALCCTLLTVQPAFAGKLKGANRRSLQLTRPPIEDEPKETPAPKTVVPKTPGPTSSPKFLAPPKGQDDIAYDHYTWSSGDQAMPKSVHAVVSKSMHDEYEAKMKNTKMASADDSDSYDEPKQSNQNRPPAGASEDATKGGGNKGGGSGNKGGSSSGDSSQKTSNKGTSTKMTSGGNKNSGTNKGGGNKASGGGGSYDGDSYDMPVYQSSADSADNNKGSTKGGSSNNKGGGNKDKTSSRDGTLPKPPGTTPRPPRPGYESPQGDPLTGVPVSRFALRYYIDHDYGMPMTTDYQDVHEATYLWLYQVLFRSYGDRMKNLLTDDTSNIYEVNQPVTIEYASVILFDADDDDIPTTAELDLIVVDAFTGPNGQAYVDVLQALDDSNIFSTTTIAQLQLVPPGQGRSAMGVLASRVSTPGMLPTVMSAAAFFVLLAGGAAAYKSRNGSSDEFDKGFDSFSRAGETVATDRDDFTVSMGNNMSEKSGLTGKNWDGATWDLKLDNEPQENLSPINEHTVDPDLIGWSEYFDESNGSKDSDRSSNQEDQYSIEDFVNEAEKNLLGVRIRYPGQSETDCESGENETSTALVPAPSSAIVTASPSSLVSSTSTHLSI